MITFTISGNNNKSNIILHSSHSSISNLESNDISDSESELSNSLLISGYDLDGYLVSASGELFNLKEIYDSSKNTFEALNDKILTTFDTDPSYGRFDISFSPIPEITYLEIHGGYDIFRLDNSGNPKENKNTFTRVLVGLNNDVSNIAVTPLTTMVTHNFLKFIEEDISKNGSLINDISFMYFLNKAEERTLKILNIDFSGNSNSFVNRDPYDEIEKAVELSNNILLQDAKKLLFINMKLYSVIDNLCDNYDINVNGYTKEKRKRYRKKCTKYFYDKRFRDYEISGNNNFDKSLEQDNDQRKIERKTAEEMGISYQDISSNRKYNDKFIKEMGRRFNEEKERLDNTGVDHINFIEKMNDMNDIFDEFKKEEKNGRKMSKPRENYNDYNEDFNEKKNEYDDRRKNDNNFKPRDPRRNFKPPRRW